MALVPDTAVYEPPAHLATARVRYVRVLKRDPCAYCALRPGPRRSTVDHIAPRHRGGRDTLDNMAGACPACNREKGSRSLLLFLLDRADRPMRGETSLPGL